MAIKLGSSRRDGGRFARASRQAIHGSGRREPSDTHPDRVTLPTKTTLTDLCRRTNGNQTSPNLPACLTAMTARTAEAAEVVAGAGADEAEGAAAAEEEATGTTTAALAGEEELLPAAGAVGPRSVA